MAEMANDINVTVGTETTSAQTKKAESSIHTQLVQKIDQALGTIVEQSRLIDNDEELRKLRKVCSQVKDAPPGSTAKTAAS